MIKDILCEKFGKDRVLENEPMSRHTTFKIGGNADIFISVQNEDELKFITEKCFENNTEYFVMGNGSNLLVRDKGFRGVIAEVCRGFSDIEINDDMIRCKSGAFLSSAANEAMKKGLSGLEFVSGIPGTIGGGTAMNAGAYGGELKDVITKVKVLNDGRIIELENKDCGFEYRNSRIMKENMTVLEVEMKLKRGNSDEIKAKMNEYNKARSDKQPLNMPSAGSTFKRPEGHFAGKLIMDAGLRGYCIGGAAVSEKHCGFVVNKGGATAEDVIKLIEYIQKNVMDKFGVKLETEVKIIGE
ncbi:MAG: UDP-N-acetylmuramate dehydrogenase [Firmicutes bacterium]|nr:UDP-N-acetylmuramate dehydrogenase [Bacillota bacterium]